MAEQQTLGTKQLCAELCDFLSRQPDIVISKIFAGCLLEPPNVFDRRPRMKPKPEILIVLIYLFLMAAVFVTFNLWC
jgi:hypothetical protein